MSGVVISPLAGGARAVVLLSGVALGGVTAIGVFAASSARVPFPFKRLGLVSRSGESLELLDGEVGEYVVSNLDVRVAKIGDEFVFFEPILESASHLSRVRVVLVVLGSPGEEVALGFISLVERHGVDLTYAGEGEGSSSGADDGREGVSVHRVKLLI